MIEPQFKKTTCECVMKFIKILILLVAVFSIAGMAFFQLCLLLISALFAKQTYHRHNSRHNGLTLM